MGVTRSCLRTGSCCQDFAESSRPGHTSDDAVPTSSTSVYRVCCCFTSLRKEEKSRGRKRRIGFLLSSLALPLRALSALFLTTQHSSRPLSFNNANKRLILDINTSFLRNRDILSLCVCVCYCCCCCCGCCVLVYVYVYITWYSILCCCSMLLLVGCWNLTRNRRITLFLSLSLFLTHSLPLPLPLPLPLSLQQKLTSHKDLFLAMIMTTMTMPVPRYVW